MTVPDPVAGVLLTGGGSRRMGRDKATVVVGGVRLADRTASLLAEVARPVIEVGPGYTSLPCTREDPPGSGPLAALAAGAVMLVAGGGAPAPAALVLATDLPRLTAGLLRLLADHPGPGCVIPLDAGGRAQFGCGRYSADALAAAVGLVAGGHRSLRALIDRVEVTWLACGEWAGAAGGTDALCDIDTPEDLATLKASESPVSRG